MNRFRTEKIRFIQERCQGKRVLDVGCVEHTLDATESPHWLHAKIAASAASVIGIDYEAEAVEALNRRGWHMIAADAQDFDLRDRFPEGFEVIVASEIIEHLVNPGGFLRSLKKHLAPGGIIILSTPHAYGLVYFAEVLLLGEEKINDDHTMTFSKKNLDHLLDKCGLVPVEFHYLNQMGLWRTEWWAKALCRLWWGFQYLVAFVRPSLSRELLYVIGPKPEDSPC